MRRPLFSFGIAFLVTIRVASAEVITKPDGTRFDVAAGTKMTPADNNVVKLESGSLRARMPEDGKKTVRPRIVTDAATVMVMEGEALVSVDTTGTTRVSVHRGGASITAKGKATEIPDGVGVQIVKGAAPTKPKPLPIAPVWPTPARRTVVVSEPTADVTVPFEPSTVGGTPPTAWHFQVAKDAAFNEVAFDAQAPLVAQSFEAKALPPGTYHARASALDADGFEGKWSPTATVNVVRVSVQRIAGGRVRLSVEPSSAKCTVDGAATTFPTEADQHQTHDVVCGEGPAAKLVVGARPLEGVRLTTTASATGPQAGSLKVTIVDVEGQPVDRLKPVAVTPSDLTVTSLVATGAPGEYVATYTFSGAPHAVPISFRLRDDWVANGGTVSFASWTGAPGGDANAAPRDAKDQPKNEHAGKSGFEIGAAGLGAFRGRPPLGVGFDVEGRYAFGMPNGALFVGLAGGWTKLLEATREGFPVDGSIVSMRALVGYRFGTGVVAPYVTVGPELLGQTVEVQGRSAGEWLIGVAAGLGLDVEAGPGALFLELRGRAVGPIDEQVPSLTASGGLGLLGYRFRL